MAKITLSDVSTVSGINANFQKVEDELNNKVLYRDVPAGEPNTVQNDIDMNGFDLFNIKNLDIDSLTIAGETVQDIAKHEAEEVVAGVLPGSGTGTFIQDGVGAVTRTFQSKQRETVSVLDYGADPTGVGNSTQAIKDAIAFLATKGGGVVKFPRGVYNFDSIIRINSNQIFLEGEGGGIDGNVTFIGGMAAAVDSVATRLRWTGALDGQMIQFTPFPDNGTKTAIVGGGVKGLMIDGQNVGGFGLDVRSMRNGEFHSFSVVRCTRVNGLFGVANANVIGGNKSLAFCSFRDMTLSNSTVAGNTAKTMILYGHIADGNVAINEFTNCGFYSTDGIGSHIEVENCDSNTFVHCRWNGSLTLHSSDSGANSQGGSSNARHNVFYNNQGHIIAKKFIDSATFTGTISGTTLTVSGVTGVIKIGQVIVAAGVNPFTTILAGSGLVWTVSIAAAIGPISMASRGHNSFGNMSFGYSRENGIAYPTIEAGADFQFHATALGLTNDQGGINVGKAPAICLMAKLVNQSIASDVLTVVDWDAVSFDWLFAGNAGTNRVTIPNGIKWMRFHYGAEWDTNSTAGRFIGIRRNGVDIISKHQGVGFIASQSTISTQWFAVVPGDFVEMVVNQNTGAPLNLLGTPSTYLQAEWA